MIRLDRTDPLGATFAPDGTVRFLLWAPRARSVRLVLPGPPRQEVSMDRRGNGYFAHTQPGLEPGARYGYRLDDGPLLPDPASGAQPDGVDGPSALVDPARFAWTDAGYAGRSLAELVFYELHVGTFTAAGTFDGVVRELPRLRTLGVTAIELLPIAQFPGRRNWGYDGVYPFSVQPSYGGIEGLQRLSDRAHANGLALFVDVVYNHLGPEGNHLDRFGPYFTDRYRTPWGAAPNFDGPGSDEVRRFFLESAARLVESAHLDGLRVDAVHAFVDPTARPFLAELTSAVHAVGDRAGHPVWLVAESALNDPRVVAPVAAGGFGFDAMWNDDFHHALHVALTGERAGYFADFDGVEDLRRVLVEGFALAGRYSAYRGRRHGRPAGDLPAERFVVFAQNHDQVGNRPFGDRLSARVPFEAEKVALGLTLLGPYLPLLFMGSEWGSRTPFLYFTDHARRSLARAVRTGRRREFAVAAGGRTVPDPQAPSTFARSRLDPGERGGRRARCLQALTAVLLRERRAFGPTRRRTARDVGPAGDPTAIWIRRVRTGGRPASLAIFRLGTGEAPIPLPRLRHDLERRLASSDRRWGGPGPPLPERLSAGAPPPSLSLPPWSFALYAEGGA